MKHHRSPTHSYPHNISPPSLNATQALRHPSIPTLLSPLTSITNTPLLPTADALDDFQSNAWVNAPSYRPHLTGLGITYLRDASQNHVQSFALDSPLRMQVDGDAEPFSLSTETCGTEMILDDLSLSNVPYRGFGSTGDRLFLPLCDEPPGHVEFGFDSDIDPTASDTIGLIPDVNMYDRLRRLDLPHRGVNPLDTIRSISPHDIGTSYGEPAPPTPKDHHIEDMFTTDPKTQQSPSPRVIQDIMSILVHPGQEPPFLPWPSTNSPTVQSFSPSQLAASKSSISIKLEPANVPESDHRSLPACDPEYPNTTHLSPILNAHLGIELSELVSRAERFRTKCPDRDIDRAWLSHFAGKLSDRGELMNDFRCYIIGCDQRNKRRDHILVHVGAHIGQRPFACSMCPLRFLRKNECKRHEASHSGFRPYSCDICGQSFVRQDLVKRHVKRTHGVRDEHQLGVAKSSSSSRKKARLS